MRLHTRKGEVGTPRSSSSSSSVPWSEIALRYKLRIQRTSCRRLLSRRKHQRPLSYEQMSWLCWGFTQIRTGAAQLFTHIGFLKYITVHSLVGNQGKHAAQLTCPQNGHNSHTDEQQDVLGKSVSTFYPACFQGPWSGMVDMYICMISEEKAFCSDIGDVCLQPGDRLLLP